MFQFGLLLLRALAGSLIIALFCMVNCFCMHLCSLACFFNEGFGSIWRRKRIIEKKGLNANVCCTIWIHLAFA